MNAYHEAAMEYCRLVEMADRRRSKKRSTRSLEARIEVARQKMNAAKDKVRLDAFRKQIEDLCG